MMDVRQISEWGQAPWSVYLVTPGNDSGASRQAISSSMERVELIRRRSLAILVVDDDPSLRKAMQYNLTKKYGAQVATAESVAEALLKLQAGDLYNLILLD